MFVLITMLKFKLKNEIKEIGYVYIIKDDNDYVKVGISKNPELRLKQLQTGHPTILSLIYTEEFNCTRNHLLKVEKLIHKAISNEYKHFTGEWFKVSKNELKNLQNIVCWHRIRYEDDEAYFKYH